MNIRTDKILGASLALAAFSFITPSHVQAQTCITPPSCESLGYTMTEADCEGYNFLKCPFDTSKIFCASATEVGKMTQCDNVGDILYSDKTCSSGPISGKVAIGVVFDTEKRLAIALEQSEARWSDSYFDIPNLTNYATAPTADFNGKSNTKIIVDYCKANNESCPAAEYAYNYRTEGTETGDWYLPAGGELQSIYDNRVKLNETLQTLGKTLFEISPSDSPINGTYRSSSENLSNYAWYLCFNGGGWGFGAKLYILYVRPVIQF